MIRLKKVAAALAAGALLLLSAPAGALSLVHHPVQDMASLAESVVYVRVVSTIPVEVPFGAETLPATEVTVEVIENMKGPWHNGTTHTFRQIGSLSERKAARGPEAVPTYLESLGMPIYLQGSKYLLFLAPASAQTGLRAPVGIGQGAFLEMEFVADQPPLFINKYDNVGLFDGLEGDAIRFGGEFFPETLVTHDIPDQLEPMLAQGEGPVPSADFLSLVRDITPVATANPIHIKANGTPTHMGDDALNGGNTATGEAPAQPVQTGAPHQN